MMGKNANKLEEFTVTGSYSVKYVNKNRVK